MAAKPIRIVLDVEVFDDLPIGHATKGDGGSRKFAGSLGLMSTLEALLSNNLRHSDDGSPDDARS